MKISIDVIIPSYQPKEKFIEPLLSLKKPVHTDIQYYLIIDNTQHKNASFLQCLHNREDVSVIINEENKGAAETRNIGLEAGNGNWILFLDDDILVKTDLLEKYSDAIRTYPLEIGFIGLVNFPEPNTPFTRAIKASGSMDIFLIANRKKDYAWGATANVIVNRNAMGSIRFSRQYPKKGGGEDVDFFLNVRRQNGYKNFKTLPEASVDHPWWHQEKADFKRPFRYGKGNSLLGYLHPENTYYDFLNTLELVCLTLIALIVVSIVKTSLILPLLVFLTGIVVIEMIAGSVQALKRSGSINIKMICFMITLRLVHDTGVLWGKLEKGQVWRIGERFNDDGAIKKINFHRTNTYKLIKWLLYPILIILIWKFFR